MWAAYARKYAEKSGTSLHPDVNVTQTVVEGLARHIESVGRPLCPCNFYPDPAAEAKLRRWICACDEMQKYKYCHCLLFVTPRACRSPSTCPRITRPGRLRPGEGSLARQGARGGRVLEKQSQEGEGRLSARPRRRRSSQQPHREERVSAQREEFIGSRNGRAGQPFHPRRAGRPHRASSRGMRRGDGRRHVWRQRRRGAGRQTLGTSSAV